MPNTAIKVSHLTKIYKLYDEPIEDFYSLEDISFEIKKDIKC
jgi:lipopolysaccharide transport system ATP-binding protein